MNNDYVHLQSYITSVNMLMSLDSLTLCNMLLTPVRICSFRRGRRTITLLPYIIR